MCEEVLFDQVEAVQGKHSSQTCGADVDRRIQVGQVSLEEQGIGVQVSQTQKQIGSICRHQVPNDGQVKVPHDVWQKK